MESMEHRVEKLEELAVDAKQRLVRMETRLGGIDHRLDTTMASKADIASMLAAMVTKADMAKVEEKMARMETRADATDHLLAITVATKADLAHLESNLIRLFIGITISLAGVAFAAARLVH
ncbi:hypothetical protein [Janthinobacterium agaricidamnosum]|uniref:DUF1640 domain-containing protein n=1 Tax=Janthinobacterium agaricidamnosum NBRC 102515 = DSM 9628 TaxID=1349767 RepID=W0V5V2_9BURK|nr:hypothetical protein [Janthinobacterium agaricidamnosum]CDG82950.1 hypothetical protein GJA_2316 [Janthinobacterium agaricidamnosum NBRC 102515 = DSM 9628]